MSVVVILVSVLVGAAIITLLLQGTSGRPNEWPALGDNLPSWQTGSGMTWWRRRWIGWRNSSIPSTEEALGPHYDVLTVDQELQREARHRHQQQAASWMDEPGAFEHQGLVDAPLHHPHDHP